MFNRILYMSTEIILCLSLLHTTGIPIASTTWITSQIHDICSLIIHLFLCLSLSLCVPVSLSLSHTHVHANKACRMCVCACLHVCVCVYMYMSCAFRADHFCVDNLSGVYFLKSSRTEFWDSSLRSHSQLVVILLWVHRHNFPYPCWHVSDCFHCADLL